MFTAEAVTARQARAATDLPAPFARWIIPITPVCAVTATLPATRAWSSVRSTDAPAQDGASSSPNVKLEETENNTTSYLQAKNTALRLIARAEQCTRGLALKLERRGFDAQCVNTVISELCEQNLLNDKRFAQLWLESRMRLTRSPRRLLASLCGRGIDSKDAGAAFRTVFDEEAELAFLKRFVRKTRQKKRKGKRDDSDRSLKFLLNSEGFSPQAIRRYFED
jgi:regulatory protein